MKIDRYITASFPVLLSIYMAAVPSYSAADGTIQITPSTISGDATITSSPKLCIRDGIGSPIRGVQISWAAALGAYGGSATLNGQTGGGTIGALTGTDGCVTVNSVTTSGLPMTGSGYSPRIHFSANPPVVPPTPYSGDLGLSVSLILNVNQNQWWGNFSNATMQATIENLNATGTIAGVVVHASCQNSNGMNASISPSVQTATGSGNASTMNFTLSASGGEIATPGAPVPGATCMLSVLPNGPNRTLTISGINVCSLTRLSPPDPRCGGPSN